jgi:hypothetical protein
MTNYTIIYKYVCNQAASELLRMALDTSISRINENNVHAVCSAPLWDKLTDYRTVIR